MNEFKVLSSGPCDRNRCSPFLVPTRQPMDPRDEPLGVATLVSLIDLVRRGWYAGKPQHVLSYARAPSMMETCDAVRHGLARMSVGRGESGGNGGGESASSFMVVYPDAAALERDLNTKLSTLSPANVVVLNPKHLLVNEVRYGIGARRCWQQLMGDCSLFQASLTSLPVPH